MTYFAVSAVLHNVSCYFCYIMYPATFCCLWGRNQCLPLSPPTGNLAHPIFWLLKIASGIVHTLNLVPNTAFCGFKFHHTPGSSDHGPYQTGKVGTDRPLLGTFLLVQIVIYIPGFNCLNKTQEHFALFSKSPAYNLCHQNDSQGTLHCTSFCNCCHQVLGNVWE